ncbi:hypothetical protein HYH02_011408 [Chlamydomonas schloesseri]|uniref:Cyclin-like domain-containing protein n=1 Tax=Chlamydomonas schloesseri TaxID=2026947 RepID=A0A835W614_9CHLO|nr:hypothetical protein HYH02_011408 [Chlamydomonas schloesseri]|eukprot:KAG2436976.1 hypothetical protein HYH02_011408 [Chlamydomonas schloesseri]
MLALCRAARMTRETFCLAASLLDRYVAECCAAMGDRGYPGESTLQLLAMACLSLAMKYEEVAPLHSADLLRLAVDPATGALLYTAGDLGRMEWLVMQMVSWRVRAPTPASFLMLLLPACGVNTSAASSLSEAPSDGSVPVLVQLATCLLDLCVLRAPELPFQPSTTAVACLLLAERLSGASETMAQRMLQLLWCSLFPNAHQQQHQRLLLGQCLLAAEALWIAAHGGAVRRPMHTAQASSCGRPPAGSPAACTSSRAPPAHPSCPPHDMLATPVDPHACAREDNVSLIQRQYLVWAQEQHCCDAIVMPPTKSPAAVLSW